MSHSFGLFVIARIIGGVSKGNISLSTAIVADILPPQRRGKGMVGGKILYNMLYMEKNKVFLNMFSYKAKGQTGLKFVILEWRK